MTGLYAYVLSFGAFTLLARRRTNGVAIEPRFAASLACLGALLIAILGRTDVIAGVLFACLIVCVVTDVCSGFVFDDVTAFAGAFACGWSIFVHTFDHAVLGAALSALPFLAIYAGTKGRAVGLGDAKLAGVIGLSFGAPHGVSSIGLSFVVGALWCVVMLSFKQIDRNAAIPFAPFLAIGASLTLMFPEAWRWLIG